MFVCLRTEVVVKEEEEMVVAADEEMEEEEMEEEVVCERWDHTASHTRVQAHVSEEQRSVGIRSVRVEFETQSLRRTEETAAAAMAATVEVVRAREAQVEGAVADVEALKVAGPVAVGLARVVAVEMAQGTVVGVATSWAWAKPGLSGAGPTRPLQSVHQTPIRHLLVDSQKTSRGEHCGSRMHRVEASCQPATPTLSMQPAIGIKRCAGHGYRYSWLQCTTREYGV